MVTLIGSIEYSKKAQFGLLAGANFNKCEQLVETPAPKAF
jgi:hypothetical protein